MDLYLRITYFIVQVKMGKKLCTETAVKIPFFPTTLLPSTIQSLVSWYYSVSGVVICRIIEDVREVG